MVKLMRTGVAPAIAFALLVATLSFISQTASAAGFSVTATPSTTEVTVGSQVSLSINITNTGGVTYQKLVVQVFIYDTQVGQPQADQTILNLGTGRTTLINYSYTPKNANSYSVTVKIYNQTTSSSNFLHQQDMAGVFTAKAKATNGGDGFPLPLVIGIAVVIIIFIGVAVILRVKKRKAMEAAAAEAAAKAAARTQRAPEEGRVQGKFPKDYYKFRREKLTRLKPVGLTRGGTTILGNIGHTDAEEHQPESTAADGSGVCDRCGLQMGHDWKTCKNCGASGTVEKAGDMLNKLEAAGGNVTNLRDLLAAAEAERVAGNYDEAETYGHDVLDRARNLLKKHEDTQRQAEPVEPAHSPSYGPEELATKEAEPHAVKGYAGEEHAEKGYAEDEVKEKGYKEPTVAREYSAAGAETPALPAAAAVEEETRKVKKGDRKDGVACHKCGQALKPEWKKCPYCGAFQEGICPGCGRTVKMKWNVCPQCRTNLQEQPPRPACPVCGAEMAGEECQSCRARSLMDSTSRLVREVKAKGADVVEAEALIGRGELALKLKNYDKAVAHFQKAEELAKKSRREFRIRRLKEKIEHAQALVKDSADLGADVSESRGLIEKASAALAEESFEDGIAFADKAAQMAEQALDKAVESKQSEQKEKAKIPISVKKPVVVGQVKVNPRCPHCQEFVEESWPVCPFCQTPLVWKCPKCGSAVRPEWKVCPACEMVLK